MKVEIGGLSLALNTSHPEMLRALASRYSGFLSAREPTEGSIDIEVLTPEQLPPSDEDVSVSRDGDRWIIRRGDFDAEWDMRRRHGHARQTANPYSIDTLLRIVHSLLLVDRGGFLLHSSSVIRNGKAYLFSGVSGAGKTTISRLAPADAILLTDEVSYVRRDDPNGGPHNLYRACGTPFAGELAKPGENVSAPIAAVHLLAQGPENRREPVAPLVAVRALLRNVLFFAREEACVNQLFNTVFNFVESVPVYRLTFRPDSAVYDLIA